MEGGEGFDGSMNGFGSNELKPVGEVSVVDEIRESDEYLADDGIYEDTWGNEAQVKKDNEQYVEAGKVAVGYYSDFLSHFSPAHGTFSSDNYPYLINHDVLVQSLADSSTMNFPTAETKGLFEGLKDQGAGVTVGEMFQREITDLEAKRSQVDFYLERFGDNINLQRRSHKLRDKIGDRVQALENLSEKERAQVVGYRVDANTAEAKPAHKRIKGDFDKALTKYNTALSHLGMSDDRKEIIGSLEQLLKPDFDNLTRSEKAMFFMNLVHYDNYFGDKRKPITAEEIRKGFDLSGIQLEGNTEDLEKELQAKWAYETGTDGAVRFVPQTRANGHRALQEAGLNPDLEVTLLSSVARPKVMDAAVIGPYTEIGWQYFSKFDI